jgi:outer membrane protein
LVDAHRARGDEPFEFEAADDSFGINLIDTGVLEFGPVLNMVSPRTPDAVGAVVPKVKRTYEAGAFANVWLADSFRLHGEVRRALNGYDGFVGEAGADFVMRDADEWLVAIGPRVNWASGKYMDTYYGVTVPTATATGLTYYDPGSGIESYGVTASAELSLGGSLGLSLYGKYDRLTGATAKSPIVVAYGSRDQYSAGVALSYTFGR